MLKQHLSHRAHACTQFKVSISKLIFCYFTVSFKTITPITRHPITYYEWKINWKALEYSTYIALTLGDSTDNATNDEAQMMPEGRNPIEDKMNIYLSYTYVKHAWGNKILRILYREFLELQEIFGRNLQWKLSCTYYSN
jgi:hypothetical protein